ncbi:hypothetical protein C8J56DRAFT_1037608 [Mycena floridula]|nr:hypothetical protein C8J56DRAFT_1037608 [Mycena floridula]
MTGPPIARSDTKTLFIPDPLASPYLGQLSQAHVALSQVPELPTSCPGLPVRIQLRADAIKVNKVMVALGNANHDSSNGRQGHWLNTSVEKPAEPRPKPEDGWLNVSTEREWSTWEKTREAEVEMLIKVQKWSKDVASKTPTKKVVKARATSATVKGTSQVSAKGAAPIPAKAPAQPQHIADITETFLPPLFPSDLVTSKPKGTRNTSGSSRRKLSPIRGAPSSSPIDLYDISLSHLLLQHHPVNLHHNTSLPYQYDLLPLSKCETPLLRHHQSIQFQHCSISPNHG